MSDSKSADWERGGVEYAIAKAFLSVIPYAPNGVSDAAMTRAVNAVKVAIEPHVTQACVQELKWYEDLICEFDEYSDWAEHTIARLNQLRGDNT